MNNRLAHYDPRRTYNAAAVDYDSTSIDFWRYAADETIRSLALRPGERVLDVACGPGSATLGAAHAVGPRGRVLGVDIAESMISLARGHADQAQLKNVQFEVANMNELVFPESSFDAAVCVFGLFFAEDIVSTVRAMLHSLAPGGQIAVTTLGPKFFSPLYDVFIDAATHENPAIDTAVPWKRTEDVDRMWRYLAEAGVSEINVHHEVSVLPLRTPEDWWRIVMGTGVRRLAMELNTDALSRVHDHNLAWIHDHSISSVELGVIYCHGLRP